MILTKEYIAILDDVNSEILGHMGYAARKLWNIGNYEKRNYKKLGMSVYPDWYDQKKRLKDEFFYKNLPSQTDQDLLQRLEEGWKSFFTLLKKHPEMNPKPPRFKNKAVDLTFLKGAIHHKDDIIRLTIPKQLKNHLKDKGIDSDYIKLKIEHFSAIDIKELQVQFLDDGKFRFLASYEAEEQPLLTDNGNYLSIDMGIKNNFACYDTLEKKSFLLNGLLPVNHYFNKEIAKTKSIWESIQAQNGVKHPKESKHVKSLYAKKNRAIKDFIHKATAYIVGYCIKHNINTVLIGDVTGIRKDNDKGNVINQNLHSWPYAQIYSKLAYKCKLKGINFIKIKECYSSQCSPKSEEVSKKYASPNNRVRRGLYIDGKDIYNADCVGAYNIYRLFMQKKHDVPDRFGNLSSPEKIFVR